MFLLGATIFVILFAYGGYKSNVSQHDGGQRSEKELGGWDS